MRSLPLRLALLVSLGASLGVAGCSTEMSGLIDDEEFFRDSGVEEDAFGDDATADADEDSSVDMGTEPTDSKPADATASDATVADGTGDAPIGSDATTPDAPALDAADSAVLADSADAVTAPDSADAASPTDTADAAKPDTAPADTGPVGALTSTPGKLACGGTTCNSAPAFCCGKPQWDLSIDWSCETSCGGTFDRDYLCDEKADCSGGDKCCAKMEGWPSEEIRGSVCKGDCGTDPQLCMTNAECGPKSCVGRKAPGGGQTIGVCQ